MVNGLFLAPEMIRECFEKVSSRLLMQLCDSTQLTRINTGINICFPPGQCTESHVITSPKTFQKDVLK